MELGSIIVKSIKNIASKDKGYDNKENSFNHVKRDTVLSTDTSIPIEEKASKGGRPPCCSPTPR